MITVQQATQAIYNFLHRPAITSVNIEEAVGMVLAEPIKADRDFPPFDRVTMDGIAIRYEEWKKGVRQFKIEGVAAAGTSRVSLQHNVNAVEVMTGAMLPANTDTVIRYEDLSIQDGIATLKEVEILKAQSVHAQGQDAKQDEILVEAGMQLSSAEIALLASVGKTEVIVYRFPSAAVIGSGDELVEVAAQPEPHQIRRSNTYAIQAAMREAGWYAKQWHISDDKESLRSTLSELLDNHHVLILSGGVSKGKFDFIPGVLEELGVQKIFHEVSQRPGKPFWFGVKGDKRIFALPGNPVSTFMCFHRYILPWLRKSLSLPEPSVHAVLANDFSFGPKLTYFLQVEVRNENGRLMAIPQQGGGSGDFANLKRTHGFLELPMERTDFKAGEAFPFIAFRSLFDF
jgi:molybdopterin molybdotransferase